MEKIGAKKRSALTGQSIIIRQVKPVISVGLSIDAFDFAFPRRFPLDLPKDRLRAVSTLRN